MPIASLADQSKSRDMIEQPDNWPQYPYLPVTRQMELGGFEGSEMGVLMLTGQLPGQQFSVYTVIHANLYDTRKLIDPRTPRTHYNDAVAVVSDGWLVD